MNEKSQAYEVLEIDDTSDGSGAKMTEEQRYPLLEEVWSKYVPAIEEIISHTREALEAAGFESLHDALKELKTVREERDHWQYSHDSCIEELKVVYARIAELEAEHREHLEQIGMRDDSILNLEAENEQLRDTEKRAKEAKWKARTERDSATARTAILEAHAKKDSAALAEFREMQTRFEATLDALIEQRAECKSLRLAFDSANHLLAKVEVERDALAATVERATGLLDELQCDPDVRDAVDSDLIERAEVCIDAALAPDAGVARIPTTDEGFAALEESVKNMGRPDAGGDGGACKVVVPVTKDDYPATRRLPPTPDSAVSAVVSLPEHRKNKVRDKLIDQLEKDGYTAADEGEGE